MEDSNAVILARVSSKSQEDEGYSLDAQLKLLQDYCYKNNLHVCRVFKIAETASKERRRKVFHEMLSYIANENIYHLAVEKTDRFARNFRDAVAIDDWLEQNDQRFLHAVKENLLLHKNAKSDVKFMWNIHMSVAKKYTDNLREEAMKGWAEKLAQGWLPAAPPPGYLTITDNGKRIHVPDPKTSRLVAGLFRLYLDPNQSINTITKRMDILGIRTRRGKPYTKSNVQLMLENPFYIGVNRFNGKDYPGAQKPLIDERLFRQVQAKMHGNRPTVIQKHNPVFKNLIRCEDCGSLITWQLQKGHYYGVCRRLTKACKQGKMLREDKVEAMVLEQLKRLVCPSPEIIEWVVHTARKQFEERNDHHNKLVQAIETQMTRINRMDEGLYDDKLAGEITQERYKVKHELFIKQLADLQTQLKGLDETLGLRLEHRIVVLQLSQKAAQIYTKKRPEQKRLIISKLFTSLTIHGGIVSVKYSQFAQAVAQKVLKTKEIMEIQ